MITVPNVLMSLITNHDVFHYATCWAITRTDGAVIRVTDHSGALTLSDGTTYSPASGFSGSAREQKTGLGVTNMEFIGIIDSSYVSDDDLRAGLYDAAVIDEYLVDWRWPWLGFIDQTRWRIESVEWNGQGWNAIVTSVTRRLQRETGRIISRNCRHRLGDEFRGEVAIGCPVDTDALTTSGHYPTIIDTVRQSFQSDVPAQIDDYYQFGLITWTSGANADASITSEIQRYENDGSKFYLVMPTPYDITVTDTFSVRVGCGKTRDHCKGTSGSSGKPWDSQIASFGGEPDVPGLDRMLGTPNAK